MTTLHVFHDPTGRRTKVLIWIGLLIAVLATLTTVLFSIAITITPLLPNLENERRLPSSNTTLPNYKKQLSAYLLRKARVDLDREIKETEALRSRIRADKSNPAKPVLAAFYSPWQDTAWPSFQANLARVTHVMPEWLHLDAKGEGLNLEDWSVKFANENRQVLEAARAHNIQIFPLINNAEEGVFDPKRVHDLLRTPTKQKRFVKALKTWLIENRFQGVVIDFQKLSLGDHWRLIGLLAQLRAELTTARLSLAVNFSAGETRMPLAKIAPLCDFMTMLVHNEHVAGGKPGPLASLTWYANSLQQAVRSVGANKLVVVLNNYALDWVDNSPGKRELAAYGTYLSALERAQQFRPQEEPSEVIKFDPISLNLNYSYVDGENRMHTVWFIDAIASYNHWLLAARTKVRGLGVWDVGTEDPGVWLFSDPSFSEGTAQKKLREIRLPYKIRFEGRGDILTARSMPEKGERIFAIDPVNGLVTSVAYLAYPSAVVIDRRGFKPNVLALTFDDGPDQDWTNAMLDVLAAERVKATFFVLGQNAQSHPEILQRMVAEGHELGNHTFTHPNLSEVGAYRRTLELNATQRTIQSSVGVSTRLFRPPYWERSFPDTMEQVRVLQSAARLNYITAGFSADAMDWSLWKEVSGQHEKRTPEEMASMLIKNVEELQGNIVLLHDGGGDRSASLRVLQIIIPELRERGYRFEKISELLGVPPTELMPRVKQDDLVLGGVSRFFFSILFSLKYLFELTLIILVTLGLGRLALVVSLALAARAKERAEEAEEQGQPLPPALSVSVIIAAYNESKVIARTIQSILASDHKNLEIIVVDDGSLDGTYEIVLQEYGNHPLVRVLRQENTGKAGALNHGILEARNEILVCLDADTQFAPDAIRLLTRHFHDPEVGAVAGNVKVGNRNSILTHWQSIEYVYNISLSRRAYAMLNAITVVAGAAGAWRKSVVLELGGYHGDTLAEDMDLTWRVRRAERRVLNEPKAIGYTEAPEDLKGLFKQRFRWAYGSLQCLWKHRSAIFHHGWFGWLGIPTVLIFQVGYELIAPIADLRALAAVVGFLHVLFSQSGTPEAAPLAATLFETGNVIVLYLAFFCIELGSTMIAFKLDRESWKPLWLLFIQRFVYRQIMYVVAYQALWRAVSGWRQGWGVLKRTGTVQLPAKS